MNPRTVSRVAGVEVRVDGSWFVIVVLFTWSFWSEVGSLVEAVVASALFFASVLGHEIAHALEARHRGIEVRSITLYLFGGATEMSTEAPKPADEFAISAVGPWTSLVLGCAFGLIAFFAAQADLSSISEVAGLLGWLNLLLAFFNFLPGSPLDGGRVLDALVWRLTGDRTRARRVSTGAGRVLGNLLIAVGAAEAIWGGDLLGGFVLAFIGWMLSQAAAAERRRPAPPPAEPDSEPEPDADREADAAP
jgi:Zn-dependent protease